MGLMIEEIALQRGHEIVCKIDVNNPQDIDKVFRRKMCIFAERFRYKNKNKNRLR